MSKYCLSCGKALNPLEEMVGYHPACLKRLFVSPKPPLLELDQASLKALAESSLKAGKSLPGVQEKLSLHLSDLKARKKLTIVGAPLGYICKPPSSRYPALPESEALVMTLADLVGLPTCPHGLLPDQDGRLCYITRRIDRAAGHKIAMEDFCQLSGLPALDKYRTSYESCGQIITAYSYRPLLDKETFFYEVLFCFVTLNNDMHLKNFSLYEKTPGRYELTPAYDLLPTGLLNPNDKEELALTCHGKKKGLTVKDFLFLADHLGISETVARGFMARLVSQESTLLAAISRSFLPPALKTAFATALQERLQVLV